MQYWQDGKGEKTQLIVVTDEALYAHTFATPVAQQHVDELVSGKSPALLFAVADATYVAFRSLDRAQCSSSDNDIDFAFKEGKEDQSVSLSIEGEGIREQVLAALEHALHGRFKRYEDQYSRPRAAFGSALWLSIFAFATWVLANAASALQAAGDHEITGRRKGLKTLVAGTLEWLGPTGVTVIGGLLCALVAWNLVNRVKAPSLVQILQPGPYKAQGAAITVIKYLVLAVLWIGLLPIVLR
ncbi:hypothetical protein [Montanilutibacter psychrotolerans]|nr:hypothetical protein [Lysobacter psychrotolerans]